MKINVPFLLFFFTMAAGCAFANASDFEGRAISGFIANSEPLNHPASDKALEMLGSNYKWGGTSETGGMDCSGFVYRSYKDAIGLELPRTADEMAVHLQRVLPHELRAGDLVFFNTLGKQFSHVGIYLGGSLFAHAPRSGQKARIDSLEHPYWLSAFDGARRPNALASYDALARTMATKHQRASKLAKKMQSSKEAHASSPPTSAADNDISAMAVALP